jgi:ubiquinol-cytochrome c reductase cytochrome c1 subunit
MNIGKKFANFTGVLVIYIVTILFVVPQAFAAGDAKKPESQDWEFQGVFGKFDKASIKRGLQVYIEVCSSCHSLDQVAYRNLLDIGLTVDESKAVAEEFEVTDGPDGEGEMFERPARLSDKFVAPFSNENAARAANNGAYPPDLSLIAKAHPGGVDYVYSLLTGFKDEAPEGVELGEDMSYNPYYPGKQIAMAQPLYEDSVEYPDGTPATVAQMSWDMANFLHWTAEPEMDQRKSIGWKVVLFLLVLTALLYAAKRQTWSKLH